jgi:hypothetical protein
MNYTKDMKSKDETITQIINSYEDKMRRLSEENEKNEKKILSLNEKIKKTLRDIEEIKINNENEKRKSEQAIREAIVSNSEIVIQLKNAFEVDLSDDSLQEEVYQKIKEMIVNIVKVDDNKWVQELRSFISKTLLSYLDITFKQISSDKNFAAQKIKWQTTLDQIALSHEEELKKSTKKFF